MKYVLLRFVLPLLILGGLLWVGSLGSIKVRAFRGHAKKETAATQLSERARSVSKSHTDSLEDTFRYLNRDNIKHLRFDNISFGMSLKELEHEYPDSTAEEDVKYSDVSTVRLPAVGKSDIVNVSVVDNKVFRIGLFYIVEHLTRLGGRDAVVKHVTKRLGSPDETNEKGLSWKIKDQRLSISLLFGENGISVILTDLRPFDEAIAGRKHSSVDADKAPNDVSLVSAARNGDHEAQTALAVKFLKGGHLPVRDSEIIEWLQSAANDGDVTAQVNLGWAYDNGRGVPQNSKMGADLYQNAAYKSDAVAQMNLGRMYIKGEAEPVNSGDAVEEAIKLFQKAADQGDADAFFYLGVLYEKGTGVQKDTAKAAELYQAAADHGFSKSMVRDALQGLKPATGTGNRRVESEDSQLPSTVNREEDESMSAKNWYGYGYSIGHLMLAAQGVFGGKVSDKDLISCLRNAGVHHLAGYKYRTCLNGYHDCVDAKPNRYPTVDVAPRDFIDDKEALPGPLPDHF